MMEFYLRILHIISLNFEIYFIEFLDEIIFGVISGNYLHLKVLENAKRILIYFKSFWYKSRVYLKLKLLNFLSGSILSETLSRLQISLLVTTET